MIEAMLERTKETVDVAEGPSSREIIDVSDDENDQVVMHEFKTDCISESIPETLRSKESVEMGASEEIVNISDDETHNAIKDEFIAEIEEIIPADSLEPMETIKSEHSGTIRDFQATSHFVLRQTMKRVSLITILSLALIFLRK